MNLVIASWLLTHHLIAPPILQVQVPSPWEKEVVYQIFPRSFYDTNGDHVGDLNGIRAKLPFLRSLGITAILINPIFKAREYHNYFADDFFTVDPTLGSNADFFRLVREAHSNHLKVILDMEIQYVANRHPWFMEAGNDPTSPAAGYLWRQGSAFYGLNFDWFGGATVNVAAINPDNPFVREYAKKIFRFWGAPDGNPNNGVDGFRIDHMMDDLDGKHVKTGMLQNFWLPIEQDMRSINPKTFFLAEQADWGTGKEVFEKAQVDGAYAVPLRFAFVTLDKKKLEDAIRITEADTPTGKTQFVFIENHDVERFASVVKSDPDLERLGAVFNLTMKGTPLIYYGQELGMRGEQGKWNSDANDIPVRLAYRWSRVVDAPGSANFYRGSGPWDKTGASVDNDGISVEEESKSPHSLLAFYRKLIKRRRSSQALSQGSIKLLDIDNPSVVAYERSFGKESLTIVLNLSSTPQTVVLDKTRLFLGRFGFEIRSLRR